MRISFHAALLGVLMAVLAMMAIGPARQLWAEHAQIRADQRTLAAGSAKAAQLTGRIQAMQDPAHIEQLARDQLGYVRPGETLYIVGKSEATPSPAPAPKVAQKQRSWLELVWAGVRARVPVL